MNNLLDTSKDEIKFILQNYVSKYFDNIDENSSIIIHNHKPVTFIVKDCYYCQKYGNIFCTK